MTWYPKQVNDGGTLKNIQNELGDLSGRLASATAVAGAEATNVVNVAIQLLDGDGNATSGLQHVFAYLSDDSGGDSISGTAPATSVAIGTDGAIVEEAVTKLAWWLQSETDGDIDLDITETGADTWYLVVVMPDGSQVVSNAITFT